MYRLIFIDEEQKYLEAVKCHYDPEAMPRPKTTKPL